jgi:YgiT-type zinc finger domain-containing protein
MECLYCEGVPVRNKVSYTAAQRGYHLIIGDMPAWVCERCGESLFDEETVDAIQEMLHEVGLRMEKLAVPLAAA